MHPSLSCDHSPAHMFPRFIGSIKYVSIALTAHMFHQCRGSGVWWVWHDMTTMQPYDVELTHIDLNTLGKQDRRAALAELGITKSVAKHILMSVKAKAKRPFALLANTQLASLEESREESKHMDAQAPAVSYNVFSTTCLDFIAMNDMSLKDLLAKF